MSSQYFLKRLSSFGNKSAIVDWKGNYSYSKLLKSSVCFAENKIKPILPTASSAESAESTKVAYLTEKDATYVLS